MAAINWKLDETAMRAIAAELEKLPMTMREKAFKKAVRKAAYVMQQYSRRNHHEI